MNWESQLPALAVSKNACFLRLERYNAVLAVLEKGSEMRQVVALETQKKTLHVGIKSAPKYELNPFLDRLTVKTRGRKLTVARGSALVGPSGNVEGLTEIAQIVDVDEGQFVKLFTKDLAIWFDLNKAGMRVFGALLTIVQQSAIGRDMVYFDVRSEALAMFKISKPTFYRGLEELIEKGFIARHLSPGWFFTNPAMFFNGNRARFVREYRVKTFHQGDFFQEPQALEAPSES